MQSKKRWILYTAGVLVITLAAAYFLLTFYRTINYVDEGYLLLNFQKVADGQIPHLHFYDDYGPASYWVGGALLALFGTKLIIVRFFLVILKIAMTLLVFLIAQKILPLAFALIASPFFILNWGHPLRKCPQ